LANVASQNRYNKIEQEVIVLRAVWGMIDGMVNYSIFQEPQKTEITELHFKSSEAAQLCNILLADFLSKPEKGDFNLPQFPSESPFVDQTFLFYLKKICEEPKLNSNSKTLLDATEEFSDWLGRKVPVEDIWFPSLERKVDLQILRIDFLKLCGNISKHSFARLSGDVGRIEKTLRENNVEVDPGVSVVI